MRTFVAALLVLALAGCGFIYRQDIQQGNVLEQEQVDALKPGMTRRQVALVLGTPAVTDPFHRNRWDYVSVYKPGGKKAEKRHKLTVFFEGNELVRIEGDLKPSGAEILSEEKIEQTIEEIEEGDNAPVVGTEPAPTRTPEPGTDPGR